MHKFILGENPQAPETGGLWIIHLLDPVAIIEVVAEGEKIHSKNAIYHGYNLGYINTDGIQEFFEFRVHHFFTTDFNLMDDDLAKEKINDLMVKAMHWYKAYLEWEDQNMDE